MLIHRLVTLTTEILSKTVSIWNAGLHSTVALRGPYPRPTYQPEEGMSLKHRIDRSNQDRTDLVEQIDSYFRQLYSDVTPLPDATINTVESSIGQLTVCLSLHLKIYHMKEQTERKDASAEHIKKCKSKLNILLEQQKDLSLAIDQLLDDIEHGRKYMKVYRQMKMYNDPATNPILYNKK